MRKLLSMRALWLSTLVASAMVYSVGTATGAGPQTLPDMQQISKLLSAGQYQKAVVLLDKLIALKPESAVAHYYRGLALERLGQRNDAMAAFETASLLDASAPFAKDCQLRLKALAAPAVAKPANYRSSTNSVPDTKSVLKNGKQVKPFELRGEQSRMAAQVSDKTRKELMSEVGKLQDLAERGPIAGGIGGGYASSGVPTAAPNKPDDNALKLASDLTASVPKGNLSDAEKEKFAKYDVTFIVDHSGSMMTSDCPQNSSRWTWLAAQVFSIIRDAKECFPRGLNVVMFDDDAEEFSKVKPEEFAKLFGSFRPQGGTNTGYAFRSQLDNVKKALALGRPVMVVGITDGLPNDAEELQQAFQEYKQLADRSRTPLKVSLLHIGASAEGLKTLSQLESISRRGISTGASFVRVYPFADLCKYGLSRTLVNILNN
jgi:tetratricopeptide (TPR) repeat protein